MYVYVCVCVYICIKFLFRRLTYLLALITSGLQPPSRI